MAKFITYRGARANANMNIKEWAKTIGVSDTTIRNWEKGLGNPDAYQLMIMAEKSHIPMEFFCPNDLQKM